jgi:hypothetical protein
MLFLKNKTKRIILNIQFIKAPNFGLTIFLKLLVFGIGEKRFSSIKFTFKI